jgi:two-component system sensor histidine kinase ChiS
MSLTNYKFRDEIRRFSFGIILIVVLFAVIQSFIAYDSYKEEKRRIYIQESSLIERDFVELFLYLENFMKFIGHQIGDLDSPEINLIEDIISKKLPKNLIDDGIFSWTLLDFVNENKKLILNSVMGKLEPAKDMAHRPYLNETRQNGWELIFSEAVLGNPSNQYVMPVGMGVFSKGGKFYGSLVAGVNLEKLAEKIEKTLLKSGFSFMVIDKNKNIIVKSANFSVENNVKLPLLIELIKSSERVANFIQKPVVIDDTKFFYLKSIRSYPFSIALGQKQSIISSELVHLILPLIFNLLMLASIFITMMFLLQNRICLPINKLSQAADKIAKNEDVFIPYSRYHEVNLLAFQLENIANIKIKLEEAREEAEQARAETEVANHALELKVQERTKELNKALSAKTEFLNNMSHEVRTPILGFTVISEGLVEHWNDFEDSKRYQYVEEIASNAKRLQNLLCNLLDMSKFSADKMVMDFQQIELNHQVKEVIEECKALYLGNKQIEIVHLFNGEVNITADAERIRQVLRNLFFNAIKFTPDGGKIESDIMIKDNQVLFSIKDSGVGVPEDELLEIFEAFVQSSKTNTKAGGTGLGLSIAKQIIIAHNGKIWAENNEDKGSKFSFVIPVLYRE